MSRFYDIDPDDPDAPVVLDRFEGLRPGMQVDYVGPSPMPSGPFELTELVRFTAGWVQAILDDGQWECDAVNLRPHVRRRR